MLKHQLLVLALLLVVASSNVHTIHIPSEFSKCLAVRDNIFFARRTRCLDQLQKLAGFIYMIDREEDRKEQEKERKEDRKEREKDRKQILAIPGLQVDTSNSLSVAVAMVFVVSTFAAGILQCCGAKSPQPNIILLIYLGFSFGLDVIVWWMYPSHLGAYIFVLFFSSITCCALSVHFLHETRLTLSQVWNP
jgi:hypothetical protein